MVDTNTGDTGGAGLNDFSPREALITTAVTFLNNPKVQICPINQKQQFLRSKGLREDEIQIACERAGVFTKDPNSAVINMGISALPQHNNYLVQSQPQPTTLSKVKDILNSIALVSGVAYAIYLFYKKFIEPFLFGSKKKKSIEEAIGEMDKKMDEQMSLIKHDVLRVREDVKEVTARSIDRELSVFKSDLEAIKGLLLNRKQFANPIPVVPPSIPAWQLTSQQHTETEPDKNDDAGSGSGSSETEVVTKNSDSSLEIM